VTAAVATRELVRGVGESIPRVEGIPKTAGAFEYASDLWAEGMLHGGTTRSPYASARILSIDAGPALAVPGVRAVLTQKDVPGKPTFGLEFDDQPVLAHDLVRFEGEPVAIVAAIDPETARRAAEVVAVEYEVLEPLVDMERALDPAARKLHPFGNVLRHVHIEHGDPQAEADVWVEGYYETGMQDNAPLGPEAGLAFPSDDGGVDLHVNTQWIHVDLHQISACLGMPEDKVRITAAGMGGAFGAREDLHLQVHACMLALATGKPVKMEYGREESFRGHKHRHPSRIWVRTGATNDGTLVSVRVRLLIDGGAYASSSGPVIANASTFAAGPYEVPNAVIDGTAVYTNNPPCGAMRGFGAPQVCFAHEAQMDKLAAALGLSPLEIRRRNAVDTGSVLPTGQVVRGAAPVRKLLDALEAMPELPDSPALGRDAIAYPGGAGNVSRGESLARGVGFAVGYKNVAYSEGFDDSSAARLTLSNGPDGPIAEIHTAAVECGQGLLTVLTQIARTELGVRRVVFAPHDTGVPSAGSTSASRMTMMAGGAVQLACRDAMEILSTRADRALDPAMDDLAEWLHEPVVVDAEYHHRKTTKFDENGQGDIHVSLVFGAERAVVEVDRDLGLVRVVRVDAAQDVGRMINPQGVLGQIEGGTAMGLGLAVLEEVQLVDGRITNGSFTDYLIPTILDVPPVRSAVIEDPEPDVPYGVKGIGESSTIVATAAIVAAIRDATGLELNRAPVGPDDVAGLRGPAEPRDGWPPNPPPPWQTPVPEAAGLGVGQQALMTDDRGE
jgi:CO/xanthine dehydrogenase Mo-binding subunit